MKRLYRVALPLIVLFASAGAARAELHELLKPHADNFERGMKSYEETRKARIDADRKSYQLVLDASRKRYERMKKTDLVAVIDAEIKDAGIGDLAEEPPAGLPKELLPYRKKFIDAPENAAKAIASGQKFSRESYLRSLDGLAQAARVGKSPELEADVASEKKRIVADLKAAEEKAAEDDEDPTPPKTPATASGSDRE